jgi:hypothetical protein
MVFPRALRDAEGKLTDSFGVLIRLQPEAARGRVSLN